MEDNESDDIPENTQEDEASSASAGEVTSEEEQQDVPVVSMEAEDDGKKAGCSPLSLIMAFGVVMVLGAILVPNFVRARARGQLTACKSNLKNIGTAMEMYSTDYSGMYPPDINYLTPNFLKTLPECPAAGKVTYKAYFGQGPNNHPGFQDYYYVECHGENHTDVAVKGHYPAYDGISGLFERPESTR